jgi:hypothetical protein
MQQGGFMGPILKYRIKDPTGLDKMRSRWRRKIFRRYTRMRDELLPQVDDFAKSLKQVAANESQQFIFCNTLYDDEAPVMYTATNKVEYSYRPDELLSIFDTIDEIVERMLLDGFERNHFFYEAIEESAEQGIRDEFNNLSAQSQVYSTRTQLLSLMSQEPYLGLITLAERTNYDKWAELSSKTSKDLKSVLQDGLARGLSTKELARLMRKRMSVSYSFAKAFAQTEMLDIYRTQRQAEAQRADVQLGVRTKMLWQSALLPTTRFHHGIKHARFYTIDEVRDFYSRDGNRNYCYCSQTPTVIDENGEPIISKAAMARLEKQKEAWQALNG